MTLTDSKLAALRNMTRNEFRFFLIGLSVMILGGILAVFWRGRGPAVCVFLGYLGVFTIYMRLLFRRIREPYLRKVESLDNE